jgi:hypothetical protein
MGMPPLRPGSEVSTNAHHFGFPESERVVFENLHQLRASPLTRITEQANNASVVSPTFSVAI